MNSFLFICYHEKFLNMICSKFSLATRLLTGLVSTSPLNKFVELNIVFLYKFMYLLHVKKNFFLSQDKLCIYLCTL